MSGSGATKKVEKSELKGLLAKGYLLVYPVIIFFICLVVVGVKKIDFLPVNTVNLPNSDQFKCQDFVELQLEINKVKNMDFVDLDLSDLKAQIEYLDWIKTANIQYIWPDILNIDVQEYKPIAIWNNKYLLNEEAQILPLSCEERPEVNLIGSNDKVKEVMSRYRQMALQFSFFNLNIQSLEYKKYGSWEMKFESNLVVKMSETHFNLEFERLLAWLRDNHNTLIDINKIDTRYQHGLVVEKKSIGVSNES